MSSLSDLYAQVTICNRRCVGVQNAPERGIIGRSFYCLERDTGVDILLVSKNPGTSHPDECARYAPLDARARVRAHRDFVRECFAGENALVKSKYHANIIEWVAAILDVPPTHDAVFARTAMTALVKCQSAVSKTDALPRSTMDTCANAFLLEEIALLRPKFLLALGGEACRYLSVIADRHGLPIGKLYHPSWTNMRGGKDRYLREELPRLRQRFLQAMVGSSP
jgi:hypothetical protein